MTSFLFKLQALRHCIGPEGLVIFRLLEPISQTTVYASCA
jgi:hypothetical protein